MLYEVITLPRLSELLFDYLVQEKGADKNTVADSLAADILVVKGRVLPKRVQEYVTQVPEERRSLGESLTKRQKRHLNAPSN